MKAVEKIEKINGLAEIFQQNLTQFCLARYDDAKGKVVQCHQWVKCRDFMGDVFVGLEDNRAVQIFGFKFDSSNPSPDMKNTSLLIRFPSQETLTNFQKNFPILKGIEEGLDWCVTFPDIVAFPGEERVVWVLGPQEWQMSAPAFAFYSYLLKCMTYPITDASKWMEEIKAQKTNEGEYMDVDYIKWFTTHLNEINKAYKNFSGFTNQKAVGIGTIHGCTGFVSVKSLLKPPAVKNPYTEQLYAHHVLKDFKVAA